MTDKIFYHPETGRPLHQVPVGATIPASTPYGTYIGGFFRWRFEGAPASITATTDTGTFFTADPMPPLPTEVGATISATGECGRWCKVMIRTCDGSWFGVDDEGRNWALDSESITDWHPVMVVPNGHGVLDETDKRPVVDNWGDRWEWDEVRDLWTDLGHLAHRGTKAAIDRVYGPLSFSPPPLADGSAS